MQDFRPKPKPKRRGMWPVIGLVLGVALAAISWVLAPGAYQFIRQRLPQFSIGTLTEGQVTAIVGVFIFALLVALASVIVAAFAPRKGRHDTRDAALRKEKDAMLRAEKERKARKREVEAQMRKQNRDIAKRNYEEQQRRKKEEEEQGR